MQEFLQLPETKPANDYIEGAIIQTQHCLSHGGELGWLLDPGDHSILTFQPQQTPEFWEGEAVLPVLIRLDLNYLQLRYLTG